MPATEAPRPAFYALRSGGARDWLTLLHLPYTAWHLSYVAIGAALARHFDLGRLGWTLAAFLLAVGVAAHCFDELHGRPLRTRLPGWALWTAAVLALAGAVAVGARGVAVIGPGLIVFIVIGVGLVVGYNLELLGGALHSDRVFALGWGAFPVLVGGYAQTGSLDLAVVIAGAFATATALAQRRLSNWARGLRRGTLRVDGTLELRDGGSGPLTLGVLTQPSEDALRALAGAHVLLAAALVAARLSL